MNRIFYLINKLVTLSIISLVIGVGIMLYGFFYYSYDLPDYEQLAEYNPPTVTRLYTIDDKLLEEYAAEHRLFVPINAIPKRVVNAFIAAEDKNFYSHAGVDVTSILRAIILNITHFGQKKSLVGGSTITQQVVKNFLLTKEKSLARKVKEAILSYRISQVYSKDRILELYLNQIYLGGRSYGVASAALNYFNKSIDELEIEEIAYLAALPKAPSNYDIEKNYDKAKIRRDWVLDRMGEEKFVPLDDIKAAQEKPIVFYKRKDLKDNVKAEFFAEAVRREISNLYGAKSLYEGGLVIKTTLDPKLQNFAQKAFLKGLQDYDRRHGYRGAIKNLESIDNWQNDLAKMAADLSIYDWKLAVILGIDKDKIKIGLQDDHEGSVAMSDFTWAKYNLKSPADLFKIGDVIYVEEIKKNNQDIYSLRQIPKVNGGLVAMEPKTGRILAMVGGFNPADSQFNRAIQAKRQPGSVFKPFVYLSALEKGYSPSSLILDGPIELSQGAGLPTWKPKNYTRDFLGLTTLRRGVEKSRNSMTVRLSLALGIKPIMEITKRFGIYKNPERNFSISLGAQETTLLDMTNAYAILVNEGKKVIPSLIESVEDRNGKIIFKRDKDICHACTMGEDGDLFNMVPPQIEHHAEKITDPATAYQMISILEGVVQRGTAPQAKILPGAVGGKTGTTNNSNDAWFIGFSPDIVVGTYVGYDQPKSLGDRETGNSVALPIFVAFMESYLKDKQHIPFNIPKGIKLVKVDVETGKETSRVGAGTIYEAFKTGVVIKDDVIDADLNQENEKAIKKNFGDDVDLNENDLDGLY
ncbi:Penicillin-binding protein 1A [Candidatus Arcanobacter lacustris]|uniref:Penicillin-binding protein 1A n=1 Tax=Candidatus Arcanibacter lacustris TaxID=1607817 RepID=A0A0F5MPP9_9RICK|nr:Penicillin-binding protein 1A [Candidatus Arcanobacter lacustris]